MAVQEWMKGEWDGQVFYSPGIWMKGPWNGDFFYELSKLNEAGIIKFCMDNGLIAKRYECPKCGSDMDLLKSTDRWSWTCRKSGTNAHQVRRSLRKGSWFEKSHLPFGFILRFTYMWVNRMPRESVMNDLDVCTQTFTEWRNACGEVCMDHCMRFNGQVGGDGLMVDIYEAWLGEQKSKIGKRKRGNSVYVGLVRNINDCFVEVVEDRNAEVLIEVIIKRVAPGSTIILNCGSLYSSSYSVFEQLEALHNVTIKDKHYNIDGTWREVKRALQKKDDDDSAEFNIEIAELIWRRQNNYVITQKVQNFLKTISESYPPMEKD